MASKTLDRSRYWLAGSLAFASLLLIIITLANVGSPIVNWVRHLPGGDLMGHFLLMGTLSFLVTGCWPDAHWRLPAIGRQTNQRLLKAPTLVLAVVSLEELSQHWQPQRTFSVSDWLADAAGILLFSWLASCWTRYRGIKYREIRYRGGAGGGAALPDS